MSQPSNEEDSEKPIIVFLIPGHGDSFRQYQSLSNELTRGLTKAGVKASEVYTLDFKQQPTGYAGQMIEYQARYL